MRTWLVAIWISCTPAMIFAQSKTDTAGQGALAAIDACIAQLDPALDVGYARVAVRCPQLARTLERSEWAAWLPRGWKEARNDLSAGSLAELRVLVARELAAPSRSRVPSVKRLNEVLAGLEPEARERGSLWSRFRAWLRTVVERNKPMDSRGWLDRMLQNNGRAQTVIELVTYAALGLIIVLAGLIIVNEMRAAGLIKSRARAPAGGVPLESARWPRVTWLDIDRAATLEKPRLLLELVIAKLTELRRIPPAGALTVRELGLSARLQEAGDRARLSALASTAERARYSAKPPAPAAINQAVEDARELLAGLESAGVK